MNRDNSVSELTGCGMEQHLLLRLYWGLFRRCKIG